MAASTPYKVVHYNHAGIALGEAFPNNLEWGMYLNRLYTIQYGLDISHPLAKKTNSEPYITDYVLYRGTLPLFGGLHTGVNQDDVESNQLSVAGKDWKHAMEGALWPFDPTNVLAAGNTYLVVARDIALIVKDLFTTIGAQTNRIAFDTAAVAAVGQTLNYKIDLMDTQSIFEKVNDLAASSIGFDWDITWDKKLLLFYPKRGIARSFVFEIGNNCSVTNYTNNGIRGTHTIGLAQTSGGSRLGSIVDSTNQPSYRRWDISEEFNDINSSTDLVRRTSGAADRNSSPQIEFTINYTPQGDEDILSQMGLGDTMRVKGDTGYEQIDSNYRIVGIEGHPNDEGDETLDFSFDFGNLSL